MKPLIVAYRLSVFIFVATTHIILGFSARLLFRDQKKRRECYVRSNFFVCSVCLRLMNIKVKVKNPPKWGATYLLAGNHVGMIDILVVAHTLPCLFITSVEMQETPLLGLLTELAGCLFVERRDRSQIKKEMEKLKEALREGFNVVLFPEGQSTDGSTVLPFKRSLMSAAAGTVPILPFVINYRKVNGEPMSGRRRDYVCWYGDQTFAQAMSKTLSLKSLEAEIEFLEEVHVESEEQKQEISVKVHEQVLSRFTPIV